MEPLAEYNGTKSLHHKAHALDYFAPKETIVYPIAPGKVIKVQTGGVPIGPGTDYPNDKSLDPGRGMGNYIIIEHITPDGKLFWSSYAHLQKTLVKEKDEVKIDTEIGKVGDTGIYFGEPRKPHLHLQVDLVRPLPNPNIKEKNQLYPVYPYENVDYRHSDWKTTRELTRDPLDFIEEYKNPAYGTRRAEFNIKRREQLQKALERWETIIATTQFEDISKKENLIISRSWLKMTDMDTRMRLLEGYRKLYALANDQLNMARSFIGDARLYFNRGNIGKAESHLNEAQRNLKLAQGTYATAIQVWQELIEAGETLAKGFQIAADTALTGLATLVPGAPELVGKFVLFRDFATDSLMYGMDQASKEAIVKIGVSKVFSAFVPSSKPVKGLGEIDLSTLVRRLKEDPSFRMRVETEIAKALSVGIAENKTVEIARRFTDNFAKFLEPMAIAQRGERQPVTPPVPPPKGPIISESIPLGPYPSPITPSRPTTITPVNARIDAVDIIPKSLQIGQSVVLRMKFINTGNTTHTFIAGASLWRPDGDRNPDLNFEKPVTLSPGQSTEVTWNVQVDRAGNWGYQFAVWRQKPYIKENLLAKQPSPIEFFPVSAAVAVNPQVGMSPTTATIRTTLREWGTGFTPNSTVILHFKKPDGSEFPSIQQRVKPDGTFSFTYTVPPGYPTGTFDFWAVDVSTGKRSNVVAYTIIAPAQTLTQSLPKPSAPQPTPEALPSQSPPERPAQHAPPHARPAAPDPQLLAQVQQMRAAFQQINAQVNRIPNLTGEDRAALSQEFQRASQALQAAEAAAQRGDRVTLQTQLGQAQQALGAASQRLAQIAQRPSLPPQQASPTPPSVSRQLPTTSPPSPTPPPISKQPSVSPPSPIPPAPLPTATTQSIAARIDRVEVTPERVQVGQSVTLRISFTNTGSGAHNFIAGASLWRPDGDLNPDVDFEKVVTLAPGQTTEVLWTYRVDKAGNWGYQFAVWRQKPYISANLLTKQPSPIKFFPVTGAVK